MDQHFKRSIIPLKSGAVELVNDEFGFPSQCMNNSDNQSTGRSSVLVQMSSTGFTFGRDARVIGVIVTGSGEPDQRDWALVHCEKVRIFTNLYTVDTLVVAYGRLG